MDENCHASNSRRQGRRPPRDAFSEVEFTDGGEADCLSGSSDSAGNSTTIPRDSALYSSYSARWQLDSRSRVNSWELARRRNELPPGTLKGHQDPQQAAQSKGRLHQRGGRFTGTYSSHLANEMLASNPYALGESRSAYGLRKIPLDGVSGHEEIISEAEELKINEELLQVLQKPEAAYITSETRYCVNLYERQLGIPGGDILAFQIEVASPTLHKVLNRFYLLGFIPAPPNVCQVSEMIGNFSGYPVREKSPAIGEYYGVLNLISPAVLHFQHKSCPWYPRTYLSPRSLLVVKAPSLTEYKMGYKHTHQPFHSFEYATRVSKDYRLEVLFATVEVEHLKHLNESILLTDYATKRMKTAASQRSASPAAPKHKSTDEWIEKLRHQLFDDASSPPGAEEVREEAVGRKIVGKPLIRHSSSPTDQMTLDALKERHTAANQINAGASSLTRDSHHILHGAPL